MDSLTGGSSDRVSKQAEIPSRQRGRKNLMQRLLRRNGSTEIGLAGSRDSTASAPKHSVVERLEGFFVQDLPAEMGNFPPPPEEPAARVADQPTIRSAGDIKTLPKSDGFDANEENSGGVSSTYSAVRTIRTTAKEAIARSQEVYQEIEAKLKVWAQELEKNRELLSQTEAAAAVTLRELRTQATKDVAELLEKGCQPAVERSVEQLQQRSEAATAALSSAAEAAAASLRDLREAMARSLAAEADTVFQAALARSNEQLRRESEAVLAASSQLIQRQSEAVLAGLTQQLQQRTDSTAAGAQERLAAEKQRFLAEADAELQKLRASRDGLIDGARKQMAASVQPSLDALAKSELEKARGELEGLRANFVNESQSQVVSTFRSSIDLLTKDVTTDLVERANADLAAARQVFVQDLQKRLDAMRQETIQRVQSQATETAERASVSLNASNQLLLEKAHAQVADVARDSFSSMLESEIKGAIERGRQELGNMVDGFLAKAVPQIQVELEKLVSRQMDNVRTQPEPQIVARPAPPVSPVQTPQQRIPALHPTAPQNPLERPSAPAPAPQFGVSQLDPAASPAARFSAPQIDPMAITTSQLARAKMIEPSRTAPLPAAPVPTPRALEFRLAESAAKQRRIEVRDLKAGISSGLKLGLAIGAVALVVFGIYFFLSPAVRLKANPPAAFFDDNPAWSASQRARETQLARLYWRAAVTQIQPKYAFGSTLPENAPDEFAVPEIEPAGSVDAAARARYWEKLRTVWPQPASWERLSKWDVESLRVTWNNTVAKISSLFGSSNTSSASP